MCEWNKHKLRICRLNALDEGRQSFCFPWKCCNIIALHSAATMLISQLVWSEHNPEHWNTTCVLTHQSQLPFKHDRTDISLLQCDGCLLHLCHLCRLFRRTERGDIKSLNFSKTQMRNLVCVTTLLIFQNAKYLHLFVSVPCLAEADAALVLVKYEIISADLMLDYAHILIAKQCCWHSCCINSSLLRVPLKSHIFGAISHINNWKWNLEIHTSEQSRSSKHFDWRQSASWVISINYFTF